MERRYMTKRNKSEAGAALLIAIFALLLISVIAIALVVSSGTDTALKDNYRTSTGAYYAALAGVEEARGRLLWKNPDSINVAIPGYFPDPTNPTMALYNVLYIKNPVGAETVNPTDLGNNLTYPDKEFETEFGIPVTGATVQTINSVSGNGVGPGPLYKWVRITGATEKSLGLDVDNDGNTTDGTSLLYYDPAHISGGVLKPGLVKVPTPTSRQALEITALAAFPPNTQKLLQYVVVPSSMNLTFPAALTIAGNVVAYAGPGTTAFHVSGNDQTIGRTCALPLQPAVEAIGVTNLTDLSTAKNGTTGFETNYPGYGYVAPPPSPATPSVGFVTLAPNFQKVSDLESLLLSVRQNADLVLMPTSPATVVPPSALPSASAMTALNPMTIFVDGDLDLTGWHQTGFGLLVVTGQLFYDPDASWKGIVMVVGKGIFTGAHGGIGEIDGAMLVAQSRQSDGTVLPGPNLGPTSVQFSSGMGGNGIQYDSCWIKAALNPAKLRVLSFREIVSPN
jgi:hypothetical protein